MPGLRVGFPPFPRSSSAGRSHSRGHSRPILVNDQLTRRTEMRTFDVQGIEIQATRAAVFAFIREPRNLPTWARAFRHADDDRATLVTPNGSVEIGLSTHANAEAGTVDWELRFPDGSPGVA